MSKKHFIELANYIIEQNRLAEDKFTDDQIGQLARFCMAQNPNFNRERWISYIKGKCGPNGGKK